MLTESEKKHFQAEGYLIKRKVFEKKCIDLLQKISVAIRQMADEVGVSTDQYLDSVCRWDSPNKYVQSMANELTNDLKPLAADCLGQNVNYVRSSIIRKSIKASQGTHGHQDAGYWQINSSNIYDISTWVAFEDVDQFNGALRILPQSHKNGSEKQPDFLSDNFIDPASRWSEKEETLVMSAGDVAIFNPYLWHASHPSVDGRTRTAFVMRWKSESFTHNLTNTVDKSKTEQFGMLTSSTYLMKALNQLIPLFVFKGSMAETIQYALENNVQKKLPEPIRAKNALERLLILTLASEKQHANDTGLGIWKEVRESVIVPTEI